MGSDFIDDMATYLEFNMDLFANLTVDILPDTDNALTIRRTPSAPSGRYMDASKDWIISFQILVKHQEQWQAIQTMNDITIHLDQLGPDTLILPDDASYQFIKCEAYTMPVLVEKDSRGSYIYSALFNATIYRN